MKEIADWKLQLVLLRRLLCLQMRLRWIVHLILHRLLSFLFEFEFFFHLPLSRKLIIVFMTPEHVSLYSPSTFLSSSHFTFTVGNFIAHKRAFNVHHHIVRFRSKGWSNQYTKGRTIISTLYFMFSSYSNPSEILFASVERNEGTMNNDFR